MPVPYGQILCHMTNHVTACAILDQTDDLNAGANGNGMA